MSQCDIVLWRSSGLPRGHRLGVPSALGIWNNWSQKVLPSWWAWSSSIWRVPWRRGWPHRTRDQHMGLREARWPVCRTYTRPTRHMQRPFIVVHLNRVLPWPPTRTLYRDVRVASAWCFLCHGRSSSRQPSGRRAFPWATSPARSRQSWCTKYIVIVPMRT